MNQVIFLSFVFLACGSTNNTQNLKNAYTTEQTFIVDQTRGLPGQCYQKMTLNNEIFWTEVLCGSQITKTLVKQIQTDLLRLNYKIDSGEISMTQLGNTTKQAIKEFQLKNNMAFGGLDWATINKLGSN